VSERMAAALAGRATIAQIADHRHYLSRLPIPVIPRRVGLAQDVALDDMRHHPAVAFMMFAAKAIGEFVDRPTDHQVSPRFLCLHAYVGVALMREGFDCMVPRGYIYFAMAFSTVVEMLNIRMRKKAMPVKLHKSI